MAVPAAQIEAAIGAVPDPEVPVVSIADLGIVRSVEADVDTATVRVVITPTYSGCPAMAAIERAIEHAATKGGWQAQVQTRLDPPWTTDWITDAGRKALQDFGIAPPGPSQSSTAGGPVAVSLRRHQVTCPQCGSANTEELSRFSGTACKSLRRCVDCREPFEEFKAI